MPNIGINLNVMENFISELKEAIEKGHEDFRHFLRVKFQGGMSSEHFDELVSYLEDLPEIQPELSIELSEIFLEMVPVDDHSDPSYCAGAWHFRILSLLYMPNPEVLLKSIRQALDYIETEPSAAAYGYMICYNTQTKGSPDLLGEDNLLLFYKRCADFFKNIGAYSEALDFMLSAASIFSKHGAYQSADR